MRFSLSEFSNSINSLTITVSRLEGSKLYQTPEVYIDSERATVFSDIWATGCTILEVYKEDVIWDIDNEEKLKEKLRSGETPSMEELPDILKPTISKCFIREPNKRRLIGNLWKAFN